MKLISRALLAALLAVSAGCSLMYADDADLAQCKVDDDCRARSGDASLVCNAGVCEHSPSCTQNTDCPDGLLCGFDGVCYQKWGCLDSDSDWPEASREFTFRAPLVSLTNPENPALLGSGFKVVACSGGDPSCASPVATGSVDKSSKLLTLPFESFTGSQFTGVIRIEDSDADTPESADFMPTYVHYGSESRLVGDLTVQTRIFLVNPAVYPMLASLAGVSNADPDAGTVIFIVHDCGGHLASAVSMRPEGTSSYEFLAVQGGNQPVPGTNATTDDGAGLLLNIPPDQARTFVLTDEHSHDEIDRVSINVRGRAINYVFYYPRYGALSRWLDEYAQQNDDAD
jgi:hypothetical protein